MNKVLQKNYIILVFLLIGTVFLTLLLSNIYISKNKLTSSFFEYSNKITPEEFDEYMIENPDSIIYISDKYDVTNEVFEKEFQDKIDHSNLKSKLVFIEKNNMSNSFLSKLRKDYSIDIELSKTPIVITVIDKHVSKIVYITEDTDADTFIEYKDFE